MALCEGAEESASAEEMLLSTFRSATPHADASAQPACQGASAIRVNKEERESTKIDANCSVGHCLASKVTCPCTYSTL